MTAGRANLGGMTEPHRYNQISAELDDLATVPTDVLAAWVTDRGRCLWESTFGDPPAWTGDTQPDRELATRLCAGCPVRAECLEFELRINGSQTLGVWGGLNELDRRALHEVWARRRRAQLQAMPDDGQASA